MNILLFPRRFSVTPVLLPLLLLVLLLAGAACGGSGPEELEIPVKLADGQLTPPTIQVGQGDTVTLKIETEEAGQIHLHGYDIEKDIQADAVVDFVFVADATGRFRITFHGAGEDPGSHDSTTDHTESDHGEIFASEVMEQGGTFTFTATEHLDGQTIPYHSHLHPEVSGAIIVSNDAPAVSRMEIEIKDMMVHPAEVTIRPGTEIIWTNDGAELQALTSGPHPSQTDGDQDPTQDTHGHDGAGEEEEKDVGILEVLP